MSDRTFIDKAVAGEIASSAVDDYVDAWHELSQDGRSLPAFLGMTDEEYALWVSSPDHIELIVAARRNGRALVEAARERIEDPRLAMRADADLARRRLRQWLSTERRRRERVEAAHRDAAATGFEI